MSNERILVIDDEEQIRRALRSILQSAGYTVVTAEDGAQAVSLAAEHSPSLVVLDLTLPDIDGIELCRDLRTWLAAPILVLSVRADDRDKIDALDSGADDYLTKPFSAGELLARVRALLRRHPGPAVPPASLQLGELKIDFAHRRVMRSGEEVPITKTEFDILAFLVANRDRVVTSSSILENVWGPEYRDDRQTLRVHISNLRKKIEDHPSVPDRILTEPGVGFIFRSE